MGVPSALSFWIELFITDCSLHPDTEIHPCGPQERVSKNLILDAFHVRLSLSIPNLSKSTILVDVTIQN